MEIFGVVIFYAQNVLQATPAEDGKIEAIARRGPEFSRCELTRNLKFRVNPHLIELLISMD
jgi:hypothetical protein